MQTFTQTIVGFETSAVPFVPHD